MGRRCGSISARSPGGRDARKWLGELDKLDRAGIAPSFGLEGGGARRGLSVTGVRRRSAGDTGHITTNHRSPSRQEIISCLSSDFRPTRPEAGSQTQPLFENTDVLQRQVLRTPMFSNDRSFDPDTLRVLQKVFDEA